MEILLILMALLFGGAFFLVEIYHEKIHFLDDSVIAGISISYFFLIVLPEISENLPEFPLHLTAFEYFFVLLGFAFNHLSEKFILQRVESTTQHKVRDLVQMEKNLEMVEKSLELMIAEEIQLDHHDADALRELTGTLLSLQTQEKQMLTEIAGKKHTIHDHILDHLNQVRRMTSFIYHFIIGIIIVGLLQVKIVAVLLFFLFALFNTLISNRYKKRVIFSDLDITVEFEDEGLKKMILSMATLFGVIAGLLLELLFPLNLEILYLLFSFIAGVILYSIVRYVIPEKEKGRPWLFLVSMLGFSIFVLVLKILLHLDLW